MLLAIDSPTKFEFEQSYRIHAPGVHIDEKHSGDDNPDEPSVRASSH